MDRPPVDGQSTSAKSFASTSSVKHDHEIPDPDEDDLDDLDELLDEFSSSKINTDQQSTQESTRTPHNPQHDSSSDRETSATAADNFDQQLQAQMAALMGNGENPDMRKEIQAILQELGAAVETNPTFGSPTSDHNNAKTPAATDESFQQAILRTVQRMQDSGNRAHAEVVTDEDSDDILAQMLKEMERGDPSAATGEPEFSRMLMTMMEQLTNKEILYDPMRELNDKFPTWMSNNKASVKADDLVRYEKQQRLIAEIVGKFEDSKYSDTNAKDREYIVERMQEVARNDHVVLIPDSKLTPFARCKQPAVLRQISLAI
ncbi:MAG: hypothetical protein Q9166_003554 [cf. Caloplaca sp. 2 TL-2023]